MRRLLRRFGLAACLVGLAACAPRSQADYSLLTTSDGGASFSTLVAPFYRDLAVLDVRVDVYDSFRYDGQDPHVQDRVVDNFQAKYQAEDKGFCELRNRYRSPDGRHVMVLASNDSLDVRGVVYDLSRHPRLVYAYFEGRVFSPLPTKRCR